MGPAQFAHCILVSMHGPVRGGAGAGGGATTTTLGCSFAVVTSCRKRQASEFTRLGINAHLYTSLTAMAFGQFMDHSDEHDDQSQDDNRISQNLSNILSSSTTVDNMDNAKMVYNEYHYGLPDMQ